MENKSINKQNEWQCTICTYINDGQYNQCQMCQTQKLDETNKDNDESTSSQYESDHYSDNDDNDDDNNNNNESWYCSMCTMTNKLTTTICNVCGQEKTNINIEQETESKQLSINEDEWECTVCTFKNKPSSKFCKICQSKQANKLWDCSKCTFKNTSTTIMCQICGEPQSNNIKQGTESAEELNESTAFESISSSSSKCNKNNNKSSIISNCQCLKRICIGIKHYNSLCVDYENEKEKFITFCIERYNNLLDDYCHFITKHGDEYQEIGDEICNKYGYNSCVDVRKCSKIRRHYRINIKEEENDFVEMNGDGYFKFFVSIFDAIHFNMFHLYSLGLRLPKYEINDIEELDDNKQEEEEEEGGSYFDGLFAAKRDLICNIKEKEYGVNIGGFLDDNNKYNLSVNVGNGDLCKIGI